MEKIFLEEGHDESWRDSVARELNLLYAITNVDQITRDAIISIVDRVVEFEEIERAPEEFFAACGRKYESEIDRDRHEGQCNTCIDRNHGR